MLEAVVIALFAVGLALLLLAGGLALLRLQFLSHAARAQATVVSLRPDGGTDGRSSAPLAPLLRFKTAQDDEVEFIGAPASSPPRYRVGDTVPVRYHPRNPAATARVDSFRGLWLGPTLLAAFSLPILVAAIGLLVWQNLQAGSVADLRRNAMKVTGVITGIDHAEANDTAAPSFVLIIEAESPSDGRRLTLTSEPIDAAKRLNYTIGDRVPVLIDPEDPARYLIDLP